MSRHCRVLGNWDKLACFMEIYPIDLKGTFMTSRELPTIELRPPWSGHVTVVTYLKAKYTKI